MDVDIGEAATPEQLRYWQKSHSPLVETLLKLGKRLQKDGLYTCGGRTPDPPKVYTQPLAHKEKPQSEQGVDAIGQAIENNKAKGGEATPMGESDT